MRHEPIPRRQVYDLYWYFAAERQRIFERRVSGDPPPWTHDPILLTFKFCNVFRAADRVSQYLIREVAYHGEPCSITDRLFQIIAFRTFSRIETWQAVTRFLGHQPLIRNLADGSFTKAIEAAKSENGGLYTGAFILCATDAYGQRAKYLNHVELFRHMFIREALGERLLAARSLHEVYTLLRSYPLMGDFMSYQIAIDLNYSSLVNFSENEFSQPGPGALRGIKKAFSDYGNCTPTDIILSMVDRQEEEFGRLGLAFNGLWGRRLHAIDCQGLFCEVDKYCREAVPELASARRRIKARFAPDAKPLQLFFPPKWGLNDKLPKGPVLGLGCKEETRLQRVLEFAASSEVAVDVAKSGDDPGAERFSNAPFGSG